MDISKPETTIQCWVELYADKLYTRAFYKTGSQEVAEDLVQDCFLAAFQSLQKFEGKSEPATWLFAILNNKIAGYFRKKFRDAVVPAQNNQSPDGPEGDFYFDANGEWRKEQRPEHWEEESLHLLDDPGFTTVLKNCLDHLPGNWQTAVQLKYLEEKKGELICQELGIAPTNFWQILHRAKLQLRKCLEIHWFKK
ncbi:MAG: sigma-70 family RNA polymerase sigma factor [Sphingobacteriales bacterium]|nr:sigma-70 family RNA polymerase sigma factor [Sphingobacteriales bacterium]